jgi:hypothetical protein
VTIETTSLRCITKDKIVEMRIGVDGGLEVSDMPTKGELPRKGERPIR